MRKEMDDKSGKNNKYDRDDSDKSGDQDAVTRMDETKSNVNRVGLGN